MFHQKLSNLKRFMFAAMAMLALSVSAFAQNVTVTGKVVDSNNEPIIGAYVVLVGTTVGTSTDIDGAYSLSVPASGTLKFTCIGYKDLEVLVSSRSVIDVTLTEDNEMLAETVVTAYGGRQLRSKVTNSIASVKEETLASGMHTNPAQALSGAVAGLRVSQTSGDPGATPSIVLRGGTSLNGTGSPPDHRGRCPALQPQ